MPRLPRRRLRRRKPIEALRVRIQDFREDDTPEINLIPLIDVLLCLLIFFVVTTTFDAR